MIHGHGSDIYRYNDSIIADFSSNVWFEGPSPGLLKHLQGQLATIDHYPDPEGSELKNQLAGLYGLSSKNFMVTNGSVEAFYLIALAYRSYKSSIVTPCFSEYEDACRIHGHNIEFINNAEGWENTGFGRELVWLGNPNNPDGKVTKLETLEELLRRNPETIFVVDEAYGDLCAGFQPATPLIPCYQNLVIVRSFTKSFAIPGLRLGYLIASKPVTDILHGQRMPWSVNTLALEAGRYIMDNYYELMPGKQKVEEVSKNFRQQLDSLQDLLTPIPSDCNYCLAKITGTSSGKLKQYLIDKYGILIRDASNFRGLDERYIRLAVQKPEHNKLLMEGLENAIKSLRDE